MKEKPDVLSEKQRQEFCIDLSAPGGYDEAEDWNIEGLLQAQRDADVAYYEPLIQHAKQEAKEEILDGLQAGNIELRGIVASIKEEVMREMIGYIEMISDTHFGSYYGIKIEKVIWDEFKSKYLSKPEKEGDKNGINL